MANPAKDITGQTFGYLTVVQRAGSRKTTGTSAKALWEVQCVCGKTSIMVGTNLRINTERVKSCGCKHSEAVLVGRKSKGMVSHGLSSHPMAHTWNGMRQRCQNPTNKDWKNYGARGISVCSRWESFERFWEDMHETHKAGLSLERKDNSKGYSPENCRWASRRRQGNNTRNSVLIQTPCGRITVAIAARRYKLKPITIYKRIELGWREEDLLKKVGWRKPTT